MPLFEPRLKSMPIVSAFSSKDIPARSRSYYGLTDVVLNFVGPLGSSMIADLS